MTTLFFIICAISIAFFVVFFVGCSLSNVRRDRKAIHVRKIAAPETQFADALGGRRFFTHLEHQMAEFLSHHRAAAALLVVFLMLPALAKAQTESGPSADTQATSTSDQSIPPAVARQLEVMQKKIDQLEQELRSRPAPSPT